MCVCTTLQHRITKIKAKWPQKRHFHKHPSGGVKVHVEKVTVVQHLLSKKRYTRFQSPLLTRRRKVKGEIPSQTSKADTSTQV